MANPRKVRSQLAEFCDYTTAHGLGRFVSQSAIAGRVLWLLILIGTYCGFSYHMYSLGQKYLRVPLSTSLSTTLPYEFPDVYVCPGDLATISRLVTPIDSGSVIRNVLCNSKCQMDSLAFRIDAANVSQYNPVAQALLDTIGTVQDNITRTLQYENITNPTTCRTSPGGEEYVGNLSVVPVYQSLYVEKHNVSLTTVASSYVQFSDCIGWNEAARELQSAGVSVADRILAMGFPETDRSCRQPSGVPLTSLYDVATYPVRDYVGCVNLSHWDTNLTCIVDGASAMNIEMCLQCCYSRLFTYAAVQAKSCLCSSKLSDRMVLNANSLCNANCPGGYGQKCGGDGQLLSVYKATKLGNVSLTLPSRTTLSGLDSGPYCFYRGANSSLWATYCNVPYCPISPKYDCLLSDVNSKTSEFQYVSYTGYSSVTQAGDRCMDWGQVKASLESGRLKYDWGSFNVVRVLNVSIETPDSSLFDSSRPNIFCRPLSLVADILVQEDTQYLYTRRLYYSHKPVCAYEASGKLIISFCNLPLCSGLIRSASSTLTSRIGADLLLSRFGSSLGIGFSGCTVGSDTCAMHDFTTIVHPELGLCHRFDKQPVAALSNSNIKATETALTLAYFTDTTDLTGQTFPSMPRVANVLTTGRVLVDASSTSSALRVMVLPKGQYPRSAGAYRVSPGQHLDLQLRFDKTTRYSKPPLQTCLSGSESVTYALPYWQTSWKFYNSSYTENINLTAVLSTKSWVDKAALLKSYLNQQTNGRSSIKSSLTFDDATIDDCIDQYVVQRFIQSCGCLPTFVPIQTRYFSDYPYCFNTSSLDRIDSAEQCFAGQLKLLSQYDKAARTICLPRCEFRSYYVKQATYPWPNIAKLDAYKLFDAQRTSWSYPDNFLGSRGIASLYYMDVQAQIVSADENAGISYSVVDLLSYADKLQMVSRRLAMVTVRAESNYGQEIEEEPDYTITDLIADLGGALGLWSGVSVLTVFEIVELVALLAAAVMHKLGNKTAATDQDGNSDGVSNVVSASTTSTNDVDRSNRKDQEANL